MLTKGEWVVRERAIHAEAELAETEKKLRGLRGLADSERANADQSLTEANRLGEELSRAEKALKAAGVSTENGRTLECLTCHEKAFNVCVHLGLRELNSAVKEYEDCRKERDEALAALRWLCATSSEDKVDRMQAWKNAEELITRQVSVCQCKRADHEPECLAGKTGYAFGLNDGLAQAITYLQDNPGSSSSDLVRDLVDLPNMLAAKRKP
jgi:hypothetical protein